MSVWGVSVYVNPGNSCHTCSHSHSMHYYDNDDKINCNNKTKSVTLLHFKKRKKLRKEEKTFLYIKICGTQLMSNGTPADP